ncbi:hypothetical protein LEMLEM_LOCUS4430, partial [Lemmus lemmus]
VSAPGGRGLGQSQDYKAVLKCRVTVSAEKNETFTQAVVQIIYTLLAGKPSSRTLTTSLESMGKALALVLLGGFIETCCSPLLRMLGGKRIPGLN